MSARSWITLPVLPVPCPASVSIRLRMGAEPPWAAWSVAVNLWLWAGTTRSS